VYILKAVFPCNGSIVVTKYNVNLINNFYEENLINSKLFSAYNQNNLPVQVGKFNYFPQDSQLILEKNTNLLTIKQLNEAILKIAPAHSKQEIQDDKPIEDNFITENPFFQTLKPLN
jgi:hypothetical protein